MAKFHAWRTVNSLKFIWFIKIFYSWTISNNYYGYNEVLILLDNWSFYKSSTSISLLKTLGYTVAFLPAYSPDFAPIEMCFILLKRNLSESWKKENSKLSLKVNKAKVYNSLSWLNKKTIKNLFGKLICNINEYI